MIYIFDVEGTLSICDWRLHLLPPKGVDHVKSAEYYMAFHNAFPQDKPYLPMEVLLSDILNSGICDVYILTGMMENHREKLEDWLLGQVGFASVGDDVIMRANDDFRSSPEFKLETIKQRFPEEFASKQIIMFDDRQDVVDIMTANGIHCFKVNQI